MGISSQIVKSKLENVLAIAFLREILLLSKPDSDPWMVKACLKGRGKRENQNLSNLLVGDNPGPQSWGLMVQGQTN